MKLHLAFCLVFVLATAEAVGASSWFSKAGMFQVEHIEFYLAR